MSRAAYFKPPWIFSLLAALVAGAITAGAQGDAVVIIQVSEGGLVGIEGPAVDAAGDLYFVHFIKKNGQKLGRISRLQAGAKKSEPFAELSGGSIGNGIRFDKEGRMYVADYPNHNVLVFEKGQPKSSVYFTTNGAKKGAPQFNQPNDLAIGNDGTIYASDPLRKPHMPVKGQVWRMMRDTGGKGRGEVMESPRVMGATNGIDVSPDGKTLYVGESTTGQVWAYQIDGARLKLATQAPIQTIKGPQGAEIDGLRTDVDGRIYVTLNGGGAIFVLKPDGTIERTIKTAGKAPSNLTFGGPDGRTVFVTQGDGGFIETFRVDRPGREPCMQFGGAFCAAP